MKLLTALLLCFLSFEAAAAATDNMPVREADASRKSKNGKLTGDVSGVKLAVTYGRPKVSGRNVFKELVKPGEVWRAGADEATVVAFDNDVLVEGQKLPAGVYAFFAIPGKDAAKDSWTIIFNKQAKQWGAFSYDTKQDALRVTVTPKAAPLTEELTFVLENGALVLKWEKVAVPVQLKKA